MMREVTFKDFAAGRTKARSYSRITDGMEGKIANDTQGTEKRARDRY
jgi:hypothetical protein